MPAGFRTTSRITLNFSRLECTADRHPNSTRLGTCSRARQRRFAPIYRLTDGELARTCTAQIDGCTCRCVAHLRASVPQAYLHSQSDEPLRHVEPQTPAPLSDNHKG
jgi:hypothetical protein